MTIWQVNLTIRDEKAQSANHRIYIQDADVQDGAELSIVVARTYAALLDPFITGQITNVGIVGNVTLPPTIKGTPNTTSDVEEGLIVTYNNENRTGNFRHRIPTFREDLLASPTSLADYLTILGISPAQDPFFLMQNTTDWNGGAGVSTSDQRGVYLDYGLRVKEQFKRSRRRR